MTSRKMNNVIVTGVFITELTLHKQIPSLRKVHDNPNSLYECLPLVSITVIMLMWNLKNTQERHVRTSYIMDVFTPKC